jgi:hypothetical protein
MNLGDRTMRTFLAVSAIALSLLCSAALAQSSDETNARDTIDRQCREHGFKAGTALFSSCYEAVFARRIAVVNQAIEMSTRQQKDAVTTMYGYIMPDGQLVVCSLSPSGVTKGCTNNLQLAWP